MPSNENIASPNATCSYKVLVIGGSYAGLAATVNLLDLCDGRPCRFKRASLQESTTETAKRIPVQITIVDERDGYYHVIGSPLALATEDYASIAWKKFDTLSALQTPQVRCIQGSVETVDCQKRLAVIKEAGTATKLEEKYDYLIASSGLRRTWPSVPQSLGRAEYISETTNHITQAKNASNGVVVIGGGAVGIEMAAELKLVQPNLKITLIHSRSKLLSAEPLSDEFKDRALELLQEAGVDVFLNSRVAQMVANERDDEGRVSSLDLKLSDGGSIKAGHVINAVSQPSPTSSYLPAIALDKDGYVKIEPSLTFSAGTPNSKYHFAAGDIASWSGIKRCGTAMHHGHYAAFNIHQQILSDLSGGIMTPTFLELQPNVPPMMGLAVGKKAATYSPAEGVKSGEDVLAYMFGDDLGYSICWNYMRLGDAPEL